VATILLREYERRDTMQLEPAVCEVLRTVFKATVQPSLMTPGTVDIALADVVGTAAAGGDLIVVQPKIAISQVLFMLAYTADPSTWRADASELGTYDDVTAGITSLFAQVSEHALQRGVLHGYHEVEDDSVTVRGRIDLARQMRTRPGLDIPLAIRYTEFDADIVENRLILAAGLALHVLRTRDADAMRRLRRVIAGLAAETTFTRFHPASVPSITWTRLNSHYRPAVELARLILTQASPHLSVGSQPVVGLALSLAGVFERFVRTALAEALHVSDTAFPDGTHCPPLSLDEAGRIRLEPDLSWWHVGQCRFVGDVKYKRDAGSGLNPDLYQLHAYATATRLSHATLVYADGPPVPRRHTIPPLGIDLSIEHLDLTRPPKEILGQVAVLADRIAAERSSAVQTLKAVV
jgi:5-methylcytosine-specific restriction enzyme subunit McrC